MAKDRPRIQPPSGPTPERPVAPVNPASGDEKPITEAVALHYDPDKDDAPVVVAAGSGHVARRIVETAQESGVAIQKDPELAHALNLLGLGKSVPPELYVVVAQILLFVSDMDGAYTE